MKVTFLGVGSAFSRMNGNSALLVESGPSTVLVDCGRTVPGSLEQLGRSMEEITHIVITHLHSDHIGGLEEIAFRTCLELHHRITLVSTASLLERLWEKSLRGGLEFIEEEPGDAASRGLEYYFDLMPVEAMQWISMGSESGLSLYLRPTPHVQGMDSFAIEGRESSSDTETRFLFSGDTTFWPELIQHGVNHSTLVFHDCQLIDVGKQNRLGVHTSYNQLMTLPKEVRRRLWLYHYGDEPRPDAIKDGFLGMVQTHQSFDL